MNDSQEDGVAICPGLYSAVKCLTSMPIREVIIFSAHSVPALWPDVRLTSLSKVRYAHRLNRKGDENSTLNPIPSPLRLLCRIRDFRIQYSDMQGPDFGPLYLSACNLHCQGIVCSGGVLAALHTRQTQGFRLRVRSPGNSGVRRFAGIELRDLPKILCASFSAFSSLS